MGARCALHSLSLVYNGFAAIPAALRSASALRDLDMGNQHGIPSCEAAVRRIATSGARIAGLHMLKELRDLRGVRLWHVGEEDPGLVDLRSARPDVVITSTGGRDTR